MSTFAYICFWTLYSVLLLYLSMPAPVLPFCDYYGFNISPDACRRNPLIVLLQEHFASSWLFEIPCKCCIKLLNTHTQTHMHHNCWYFNWESVKYQISLESINIFVTWKLSIHEHDISSYNWVFLNVINKF